MRITFIFILLISTLESYSQQDYITLKFFDIGFHFGGDLNADNMPTKLDKNGYLVLNLGASLGYEKFIIDDKLSIKSILALYSDCGGLFGGFIHTGFRAKLLERNKHSILTGLGPTLIFRRNWHSKFDNYINLGYFKGNKDVFWQYKFLWYGGEIEYYYQFNKDLEFSVGFIPGYPKFMSLSIGVRYLISEKE